MPTDKNIELTISDGHESAPPKAAKKILDVAYDLFYRRGIRAIGVDEIVKRAGVTKPSLYRSFPSKDELAASYLRQYDLEYWERFDEAVAAHPGDPRAQIKAFLTRIGKRTQVADYRGCGMTNAAVESRPQPSGPRGQRGQQAGTAPPAARHGGCDGRARP